MEDSKDSQQGPSTGAVGGVSPGSRWPKCLLAIFCGWHAIFLIVSIIPAASAFRHPLLDFYRLTAGGQQEWNMLETIPTIHSFDLQFEAEDGKGGKVTAGCILPGFQPNPKPEQSRYYVLFHRMLFFSQDVAYRDAYLRKAAQGLAERRDLDGAKNWALVVDLEYTRHLFHIRRDGQMTMEVKKAFDLSNPEGDTP